MSQILRRKDVIGKTGLSKSTIYELIEKGEFPKPVKLSRRSVGWLENEISEWIQQKIKESRSSQN